MAAPDTLDEARRGGDLPGGFHSSFFRDVGHLLKCFWRCFCWTLRANPEPRMPAGRAKKEMAKTEKQEAMILPTQVRGTVSP